jgi:methanethiol S-methyltransferase
MTPDHFILAFLWIVYGVLHSVLASARVKNYFQNKFTGYSGIYRLVYNLIAFTGLGFLIWLQVTMPTSILFERTTWTTIIGGIISATGALLMMICIKKYFLSLSGLKSLWREETSPQLIIAGIHQYVRHPLYLGTFLFIWGLLGLFPMLSLLISNLIITIYTLIGIRFEERKLVKEFGNQYIAYQERVPKIIPRLPVSEGPMQSHRQKNSFGR